jgi:hypothetical protein
MMDLIPRPWEQVDRVEMVFVAIAERDTTRCVLHFPFGGRGAHLGEASVARALVRLGFSHNTASCSRAASTAGVGRSLTTAETQVNGLVWFSQEMGGWYA